LGGVPPFNIAQLGTELAGAAAQGRCRRVRMDAKPRTDKITIDGVSLQVTLAGDTKAPALLLLHGMPNAARMFLPVIPALAPHCRVVAPDMPGSGGSDVIENATFERIADLIEKLLDRVAGEKRFIYLHDFGAPVGLSIAMRQPDRVLGLIIQNANAHLTGHGPGWAESKAFWAAPNPRNEAATFAHLTYEGTRAQYVDNVPEDIAARMDPQDWEEDWRVMSLPGRLELQKDLIRDHKNHIARFPQIAAYLKQHQPPALMLWGRHDPYFALAETQSWLEDLPRMEGHILDGPHLLLETHAELCALLMKRFVLRCLRGSTGSS
jgi:pimeloyl-ACP methyl ester carboxylesterase